MNIMLTSVGRRAYMVKYFKEILDGNGEVHVSNSDDKTVAFIYADRSVISPLIYSDEYIPFLLDYCKENKIDILLSLFDIDLLVLAKNKERFKEIGTVVVVSDEKFISVCNDKWMTYLYLAENSFKTPKTYCSIDDLLSAVEIGDISYPIIMKPRFGCGSIAIAKAEDEMELLFYYKSIRKSIKNSYLTYESEQVEISKQIIFQEFLDGQEYGADIINDLNGRFQDVIIRKKLAMRAGETDIAELVDVLDIREELERLGEITGHIGNLDTDIFLINNVPYILELNARFGGGYPFSHMGGCNLPGAIIKWRQGEDVPHSSFEVKTGTRGYKELIITQSNNKVSETFHNH